MLQRVILLIVFSMLSTAAARPQWGLGLGYEGRLQKEVNPDYMEVKSVYHGFVQARFHPWIAHLDLGYESGKDSSGGLTIASRSYSPSLWGRYEFLETRWRPFVGTGVGAYFDRVTSTLGSASDERNGRRLFWGLGGGLSATFWDHFLVETEARLAFIEDRRDPLLSLLLRLGVEI